MVGWLNRLSGDVLEPPSWVQEKASEIAVWDDIKSWACPRERERRARWFFPGLSSLIILWSSDSIQDIKNSWQTVSYRAGLVKSLSCTAKTPSSPKSSCLTLVKTPLLYHPSMGQLLLLLAVAQILSKMDSYRKENRHYQWLAASRLNLDSFSLTLAHCFQLLP